MCLKNALNKQSFISVDESIAQVSYKLNILNLSIHILLLYRNSHIPINLSHNFLPFCITKKRPLDLTLNFIWFIKPNGLLLTLFSYRFLLILLTYSISYRKTSAISFSSDYLHSLFTTCSQISSIIKPSKTTTDFW